ncbi:hypothetical protein K431DRAFT_288583 [Polychaeton citri CBS 116435]|uniref:Uncharacterized protein n=1 Tax=Polychaeton citri CBS 116435 TaxID=1314669 RepID=A0A9P4Q2W4_9PEZI|nr:hypothetical protein K431DRAFT_288583 [Polychaeton citri CBS 116435]
MNTVPAPSDPVTPSEVPSRSGTPNSTTTSMSELSTIAIKDGHRGSVHHHTHHGPTSAALGMGGSSSLSHSTSIADAERADRISRLAGLERVATSRNPGTPPTAGNLTPGAAAPPNQGSYMSAGGQGILPPGGLTGGMPPQSAYFDAQGQPQIGRERSTVGSASATGSVGGRTTWAGSEMGDADKMSESQDMEMDNSSVGGLSEEGTPSLVGFGEGARTPARQTTSAGVLVGSPGSKGGTPTGRDARMIDGMTYDRDVVDTTTSPGGAPGGGVGDPSGTATEQAERIMRENMDNRAADGMSKEDRGGELGKFIFEK